jgi:hypothetical protein
MKRIDPTRSPNAARSGRTNIIDKAMETANMIINSAQILERGGFVRAEQA